MNEASNAVLALRLSTCLAVCLLLIVLTACSSSKSVALSLKHAAPQAFQLSVHETSMVGGGHAELFSLHQSDTDATVILEIEVSGATDLKALYFKLEYDGSRYSPASVTFSELLSSGHQALELAVLDQPGAVHGGQVLAGYENLEGFTGSGILASIAFNRQPAQLQRHTTAVPTHPSSAPVLAVEQEGTELVATWDYASSGDYDQNSEVNIADLSPLGQNFSQSGEFARTDARSVIDGDSNGEINISDLSPIGREFGNTISGYSIYSAADDSAYSDNPEAASTIQPMASVAYSTKQGQPGERLHFTYTGPLERFTWVRPKSGEQEGTPSNLVELQQTSTAELMLANNPEFGDGSQDNPYLIVAETDYYLAVVHPQDGNVGALTEFTLSDPAAGSLSTFEDYGSFELATSYTGLFDISAAYSGAATDPAQLHFAAGVDLLLILEMVAPPGNGLGLAADPFIVAAQTPYEFTLFSIADGDVTSHPQTQWRLSDPSAGSVIAGQTATLMINAGFTGMLAVTATYQGRYPQPASFYLRVPEADATLLTLETPAEEGDGSFADPYEVDNMVDYALGLTHSTAGDVGSAPETSWELSDSGAGQVNVAGATAVLELADGWTGELSLTTTYKGLPSIPPTLWLEVVNASATDPPTADLQVSDDAPNVGDEITFDASGSTDTDGTVDTFSYDFYGSGSWYLEDTTDSTYAFTYYTTGVFDALVRARDNDGATDTATVQVTVTDNGNFYPVASLSASPLTGEVPLTVNFDASGSTDDQAITRYLWDLDGDGNFETDTGTTSTTSHEYTADGILVAAVKVYDADDAWDYAEVDLDISLPGGNHTPIADIKADPTYGSPGMVVTFNASHSDDPDHDLLTFEWDWDGDGTYDHNSGNTSTAAHQYDSDGTFPAEVKVTDPGGAFDTASINITVDDGTGTWHIYTAVAPDGVVVTDAGGYPCLRMVDGLPAIAYQDTIEGTSQDPERTMFVRATDVNGATWGTPVAVHTPELETQAAGIMNDLEIVNGNPAVCWAELLSSTVYGLHYQRADDPQGTSWTTAAVAVDANGTDSRGRFCDLEVVADNPAICYFDGPNKRLMYCRATDLTGGSWGTKTVVLEDPGESVGEENSMYVVDGNPAIATYNRKGDVNVDKLLYIRATDATGSAWASAVELDNHQNVGYFNTLLVNNGVPVVGCLDFQENRLLYFISNNSQGTSWAAPVIAATDGSWSDFIDGVNMALVGGVPMFSYTKEPGFVGNPDLRVLRASDTSGSLWNGPEDVDELEIGAGSTSMQMVNGHPAVAFYDEVDDGGDYYNVLKFAIYH